MPKVQFVFCLHNHQPVGNFEFVAEEAYQKSYLPFIKVLEQHPRIRVVLHYTGPLYQFFKQRHPEFLDALRDLAADGRIEVLSGGLYEPILAVLPERDRIAQLTSLTALIKKHVGYKSSGMWLAERVWEPQLPRTLAAAGIHHVVVDDFHFKMAGLRDQELSGYYLTEEQDSMVRVFPGSERLRYLIPFRAPEETIEFLSGLRSKKRNALAVMADDGEKFGVWPETYRTVYEEGWLERFFTLIEENSDWLETATFTDYLELEKPVGSIFLPTASYMEMGEWTLPTPAMKEYIQALDKVKKLPEFADLRPFIKGGIWRNFLAKYPESNHLHKRMLMVSGKVEQAVAGMDEKGRKSAPVARMRDHLLQSQCNDAYWHGVFGGLYLPHLRSGLYEQLIQAELIADGLLKGKGAKKTWLDIETGDFDMDGSDEAMLNSELLNIFIDPAEGGRITEIDWKPRSFNLTNALTRRAEAYHDKISCVKAEEGATEVKTIHDRVVVKEEGLEALLQYDPYKRGSLLDHFLGPSVDLVGFMRSEHAEDGDFVDGVYSMKVRRQGGAAVAALERVGSVAGQDVRVRKEVTLRRSSGEIVMSYEIANLGGEELNTSFGSEFNFSLLAGNAHDRYYVIPGHVLDKRNLASLGETNAVKSISLVDEWLKLKLTLSFSIAATTLWRGPIETVSQSEAGFERVYQSSMVMPIWKISLRPGKAWTAEIILKVE